MSTRRTALPNLLLPTIERLVRVGLCLALALAGLAAAPAAGSPPVPGRPSVPGGAPGPAPSTITAEQAIAVALASEVGSNDFRISHMGGDTHFSASTAAVAYNSANHEYLVVWWGDDDTGGLGNGEEEIFGQRVDAATGAEIGENDFRISDMGPDGDPEYGARDPALAYNSANNEYLVVWRGDDNTAPLVDEEYEIFGQRLDAATGAEIGGDFRISDMGPDGDPGYGARNPALAYNSANNEYLVVWHGDDAVDGEFEIFGQRINAATGAEIGEDFRISHMGPDGVDEYGAFTPAVAYNSADNAYLVVWDGDDNTGLLVSGEHEIFGQRVDAATGAELGGDFRISDMGPDGNSAYSASEPVVAYNSANNEYLVVWRGDDNTAPLVDNEVEIFGQRVDAATGAEIGVNDFRISDMGPNGNPAHSASEPDVAYNSQDNEYLVVWHGDDAADGEFEIFGQRINAATGAEIGGDLQLSHMGPDGDANYGAFGPALAHNSADNEYLVVWDGDDDTGPLVDDDFEIFGQRINAATGAEIGADFRLSDMGGDTLYDAYAPAVAYNSQDNEYLVVWQGDDNTGSLVDGEFEIFGQRINAATGAAIGGDFRISDMGPDGHTSYAASAPAVAYNSVDNQYLVVWRGDDNTGSLVDNEFEIYGQRINAATGAEIGVNDFRISDMGPDGITTFGAFNPALAYNSADNEYLVVWSGDDNTGGLVDNEREIFGQRINAATGAEIGANDFRISDMGPDGTSSYGAFQPAVAYNSQDNEYLVVWWGDDNTGELANDEFEIFGQRINANTGAEIGANDFRISDMGPDGDVDYGAFNPAVAYNRQDNQYLVVWHGDDNTGGLVDGELEIFGQRVDAATGAEIGGDIRLSDMGPDGNPAFDARDPAVAYNSANNEYLVVWSGDDDTGALVDEEREIFGQRVGAATGAEIGTDFRISDMGPDGDEEYGAFDPAVAYNSVNNQYLVVWEGDDNTGDLVDEEFEIFGQRLASLLQLFLPYVRR